MSYYYQLNLNVDCKKTKNKKQTFSAHLHGVQGSAKISKEKLSCFAQDLASA